MTKTRKHHGTKASKRTAAIRAEVDAMMRYATPLSIDLRSKAGTIVTVSAGEDRRSIALAQPDAGVIVVSGEALAHALRALGFDAR